MFDNHGVPGLVFDGLRGSGGEGESLDKEGEYGLYEMLLEEELLAVTVLLKLDAGRFGTRLEEFKREGDELVFVYEGEKEEGLPKGVKEVFLVCVSPTGVGGRGVW